MKTFRYSALARMRAGSGASPRGGSRPGLSAAWGSGGCATSLATMGARSSGGVNSVATYRRGDDERDADQHAGHDHRERGILIRFDLLLHGERRELGHQPE